MKSILFILLAGVAVGLLIAPEKGSKSWKKLVASLDDVKNKTMEEIDNLVTKSKDLASTSKRVGKSAVKSW